jgi:hypothetical protein
VSDRVVVLADRLNDTDFPSGRLRPLANLSTDRRDAARTQCSRNSGAERSTEGPLAMVR